MNDPRFDTIVPAASVAAGAADLYDLDAASVRLVSRSVPRTAGSRSLMQAGLVGRSSTGWVAVARAPSEDALVALRTVLGSFPTRSSALMAVAHAWKGE